MGGRCVRLSLPRGTPERVDGKIRIGVVGAGFGRYGLIPAFQRDGRCEVSALVASSSERAASFAAQLGVPRASGNWREVVQDPDINAVAIATPPYVQPKIAEAALEAGKAVFAEKPLALTPDQAESLHRAAVAANLPNVVDFIFRELDTWQIARESLARGAIGAIRHAAIDWRMESHDNARGITSWKTNPDFGGGALLHFASHTLYYAEWLLGPVVGLSARLSSAPDSASSGDTYVTMAVQFANGTSGSITVSNAAPFGTGHRLEIYGTDGCLRLMNRDRDPVRGFVLSVATRRDPRFRVLAIEPGPEAAGVDSRVRPVSRLVSRFLDWIQTGHPTEPSFWDGVRVQRLIEAAQRSHRLGQWVSTLQTEHPTTPS